MTRRRYWQAKEAALRNWRKKMASVQEQQESHNDFWDLSADGTSEKRSASVDPETVAFSSVSTAGASPRERTESTIDSTADSSYI